MNLPRIRLSTGRKMLLIALIALPLAFDSQLLKPSRDHRRWYWRVDADLKMLDSKQPVNVKTEIWDHVNFWTNNLHGNAARHPTYLVDKNQANAFADELEMKLEGPVDLNTIDWIWDQYMSFSRVKEYNRFRPTTPENWKVLGIDPISTAPVQ